MGAECTAKISQGLIERGGSWFPTSRSLDCARERRRCRESRHRRPPPVSTQMPSGKCFQKRRFVGLNRASGQGHAVVGVERTVAGRITPIPVTLALIFRCTTKLVFGEAGSIPAEIGIVLQRLPGQWIMIVAHTQEATEPQ